MKLVDEWRHWWRWWSVRLGILGASLTSLLIAWPDAAKLAWESLPADLRTAIPPQYTPLIGVGLFMLSMLARVIRQERLQQGKDDAQP